MITGHCMCGQVAFEVSAPFVSAGWCHCTRCQRRSGAPASASAAVARGSFRLTRGAELVTEYTPPGGWTKAFCSICGGHVYSRDPEDVDALAVRLGVVDGDPGIRPGYRQFVADAAVWDPLPDDGLPRFPGSRS